MTPRFFLSSTSRSTPPIGRALPLLLVALVLTAIGGCDTVHHQSNATDRADDATEAHVDAEAFDQADLQFEPVSLAEGETFSVELKDKQFDRGVTRITHEGTADGAQRLTAQFDPLQPSSVSIRCRNKPAGTQQTVRTLSRDDLSRGDEPIAYPEREPTSYHYIDTGETVIVSVDYDQKAPEEVDEPVSSMRFVSPDPGAKQAGACTHVDFVLNDVSERLSPDGIRFHGDVAAPAVKKKAFR